MGSVTMPSGTMESEAMVLYGPKDLRLISRPLPPPSPNEVQIAIRSTTLCGSDVHYYTNYHNGGIQIKEPLSQGHEAAGEVVEVGEDVTDLKVGDKVALEVGVPCDACEECLDGRYNVCPSLRFRSSAVSFPHYQGTLQERVNHPAKWCHRLPPSLNYDAGALLEPLSVAVHAIRKANLKPTSSCLILGAGAVGLLCAAAARASGCTAITMADIAANRLEFALENGFASSIHLIQPSASQQKGSTSTIEEKLAAAQAVAADLVAAQAQNSVAAIKGESNGNGVSNGLSNGHSTSNGTTPTPSSKFHATFECTGVESSVQTAIYATRNGGKLLLVGMGTPIQTLPIAAAALREVDLLGVWRYANTYPRAIEIMEMAGREGSGVPDVMRLITHRFRGLGSVPEAFEVARMTRDGEGGLVVKVVVNN